MRKNNKTPHKQILKTADLEERGGSDKPLSKASYRLNSQSGPLGP